MSAAAFMPGCVVTAARTPTTTSLASRMFGKMPIGRTVSTAAATASRRPATAPIVSHA